MPKTPEDCHGKTIVTAGEAFRQPAYMVHLALFIDPDACQLMTADTVDVR